MQDFVLSVAELVRPEALQVEYLVLELLPGCCARIPGISLEFAPATNVNMIQLH